MGIRLTRVAASFATLAIAAGMGLAATSPAAAAGTKVTSTCANVVIMGARGSGESSTSGRIKNFGERLDDVAEKIAAGLEKGQTYRYAGISYPANGLPSPKSATEMRAYLDSMLSGASAVQSAVTSLVKSCPSTRIVLTGYSQGAFAVHWGLFKIGDNAAVSKAVRSVILLADPLNYGDTMRQRIITTSGALVREHSPSTKGLIHTVAPALDAIVLSKLGKSLTVEARKSNVPLLVDHTRTLSICQSSDPVCASGKDSKAHSTAYSPAAVSSAAAAFALPTLKKSNGNGVCDAGELCAYDGSGYTGYLTDWSANLKPTSISMFNISVVNDKTSSVWNRTPYSVTAVNEKIGRGDEKLVLRAGTSTNLTKVKKGFSGDWSNVIDHFDVSK
ncbi:cutinase family protein [Sanguibacter sp. HDW7]|uniref:cutinase family protein n=1 Tax=Sanguibacter sp. HDW7 TaxID=2714931 RepID=UPI00140912E0|nr:cutinase family protein [Sanguibacter sp. HDW7]QIK84004.1 cutinase family protein [Sanguibacter sp. HDW7]